MAKIIVTDTPIEGVKVIEPKVFVDERGYFIETFNKNELIENGINVEFVQDNQSKSVKNTLRGLHFQIKYPQDKLVRVLNGELFDVVVDIRKNSKSFGKWFGIFLSEENHKQLFIPKGLAHGFFVTSESAVFSYKCSEFYHPEDEGGIIWNDSSISIDWPIDDENMVIISEKDKKWNTFRELLEKTEKE